MTEEQLAELERLSAAATSGPWAKKLGQPTRLVSLADTDGTVVASTYTSSFAPPVPEAVVNAAFIAVARTAVPELVAEVRRLRAELVRGA